MRANFIRDQKLNNLIDAVSIDSEGYGQPFPHISRGDVRDIIQAIYETEIAGEMKEDKNISETYDQYEKKKREERINREKSNKETA